MNTQFLRTCLRQTLPCLLAVMCQPVLADADLPEWQSWLTTQVDAHPTMVAAKANMDAGLADADQLERPVYNPNILGGYEREGDGSNWRIGIGQTFDINGRRRAQTDQAVMLRSAAGQSFEAMWQRHAADLLGAMVAREAARARYELAATQQQNLDRLIDLLRRRREAGDIGQIDVETTLLSLSQRLNDTAQSQAAFQLAEARLKDLLPGWEPELSDVPQAFWPEQLPEANNDWLNTHPEVLAAKARWENLQRQADVIDRARRSAPTVALDGGKEGDENVVGIALSVPLMVRNNYEDKVKAARQRAAAAKAEYRAVLRRLRFDIEAATVIAQEYGQQYGQWQSVLNEATATGRIDSDLLNRQWQSGDLSTNEYLLILQQRIDGRMASIDLEQNYRLSLINWLNTTGRVRAQLSSTPK